MVQTLAMATFSDKPTLTGERVVLRPLQAGDGAALLATFDEESSRFTGTHRTFTLEELDAWVASRPDTDDRLDLAIIDRTSGAFVGDLAINDWDEPNGCCNFRISLGPNGRDRGLG